MVDFPALIQVLLSLLAIALMAGVLFFFRRPAIRKLLSKENRALLLLISIAAILLFTIMAALRISDWKDRYRATQEERMLMKELDLDEYSFINQTFKPLGEEYHELQKSLSGLDKMNAKIEELMVQHKNHAPLLQAMLNSFIEEKKIQSDLYKRINIEIRNAMILSSTQNSKSMQDKFYNHAKVLHAKILKAQARSNKKLGQMAGLLADNLKEARKQLKHTRIKKGTMKADRNHLYHTFSDQTAHTLLDYFYSYEPDSIELMKELTQHIRVARQKKDKMLVLSQKEIELQVPLRKTMELWSNAEMQGNKYWNNLLYAIEAVYLADQFNMPKHKPAFRHLWKDIKKTIPNYLERIVKLQKEAGDSYFTPVFAGKK